ncbi:DUF397 domain-containing protein [Actinoplanes sp. NPDC051859]|uniref:DUF397 domain-containing protein n=1 Tax=Actinoplanes sp. NPDC051859 TaxID=3363909 RepID=UPI0037B1E63C
MLNENWRTSSRSGSNGQCVEVRRAADVVEVRDSKDRSGSVIAFTCKAWDAMLGGVRSGEFDR